MSGSHECPVEGCEVQVSDEHLLCQDHWFAVPRRLRDRVWRTWHGWRAGRFSGQDYIEARDAAIAAANEAAAQGSLL